MMEETKVKGGFTVDWNKIKAEYIAGGTSYRKLAEKYGVSQSTLRQRAAREKWTDDKNSVRTEIEQKMIESVSDEQAEEAVSAVSLINQAAMNMLRQIADETTRVIKDEKVFNVYSRALKQLKEVLDIKSEKDMEEQQARIDNLRRQADSESFDGTVEFVFTGDAEKWAK